MSEYIRTDLKIKQPDGSFLKYSPTVTLGSVLTDDGLTLSDKFAENGDKYTGTAAKAESVEWSKVTGKPTTLEEFGITDITKESVGLDNVDNTSDLDKPISNATQSALNNKVSTDDVVSEPEPNKILKLNDEGKIPENAIPQHVEFTTFTLADI